MKRIWNPTFTVTAAPAARLAAIVDSPGKRCVSAPAPSWWIQTEPEAKGKGGRHGFYHDQGYLGSVVLTYTNVLVYMMVVIMIKEILGVSGTDIHKCTGVYITTEQTVEMM